MRKAQEVSSRPVSHGQAWHAFELAAIRRYQSRTVPAGLRSYQNIIWPNWRPRTLEMRADAGRLSGVLLLERQERNTAARDEERDLFLVVATALACSRAI